MSEMSAPIMPSVLVVAGTDPLCGAGGVADAMTLRVHRCSPLVLETALVAQNSAGIDGFQSASADFFAERLRAVLRDVRPQAVKLGMIASPGLLDAFLRVWREFSLGDVPIVVDPVLRGGGAGEEALSGEGMASSYGRLRGHCTLLTPNAPELRALGEQAGAFGESDIELARALAGRLRCALLLKAGHLDASMQGRDVLIAPSGELRELNTLPRWDVDVHGTGCALSTAIAAQLAHGSSLQPAVEAARRWLSEQVLGGAYHRVGKGRHQLTWRGPAPTLSFFAPDSSSSP